MTSGEVTRWTYSETGGLDAATFAEPEPIQWKSFDGRPITGFLYRPPASFEGKRPVIIHIHGGPESQFRPEFRGPDNYFIGKLGIAMIFPNVRGSTGFGKTFLALDNGFQREDAVKDVAALLDWIQAQPFLDAGRVMVRGGSYGGFMTLAVATSYDERIRCSLDIVGPSNFVTFLENTSGYRRDLRRVEYGNETDPKMREFLLRIAPAATREDHQPLFVVQGRTTARPRQRVGADGRDRAQERHAGLVPPRQGRGPRLHQEAEHRLPPVDDRGLRPEVPAGLADRQIGYPLSVRPSGLHQRHSPESTNAPQVEGRAACSVARFFARSSSCALRSASARPWCSTHRFS